MEYILRMGSFYLCESGKLCDVDTLDRYGGYSEIAMAYGTESFTLLKHGSPVLVEDWIKRHSASLSMIEPVETIIFNTSFPVAEINKILNTSGYIRCAVIFRDSSVGRALH